MFTIPFQALIFVIIFLLILFSYLYSLLLLKADIDEEIDTCCSQRRTNFIGFILTLWFYFGVGYFAIVLLGKVL